MTSNGEEYHIKTIEEAEQAVVELLANIIEMQDAFNRMREAINNQAETLALHHNILFNFVPAPLLEKAAKEYRDARQREIATATTPPANA